MTRSLILLAFVALTGCRDAPGPQPGIELTEQEARIARALAGLHRASHSAGSSVWPRFSPLEDPLLITAGRGFLRRAILVNHPSPPAETRAPRRAPSGVALRLVARPFPAEEPWGRREFAGVETFHWDAGDSVRPGQDVATLVHELFHRFQARRFNVHRHKVIPPRALPDTRAAIYLEHTLLAEALGATGRDVSRLARGFSLVRAERRRATPGAEGLEDWKEAVEGTAAYVGCRARAEFASPGGRKAAEHCARARLFESFAEPEWLGHARFYGSGAAQAFLLDRSGERRWRERVAAGEAMFDVFVDRFPPAPTERLAALREQYSWGALLDRAREDLGEEIEGTRILTERFRVAAGPRIIISVPPGSGFPAASGSGDAAGIALESGEYLEEGLSLESDADAGFWFRFTRVAMMTRARTDGGQELEVAAAPGDALRVLRDGTPLRANDPAVSFAELSVESLGIRMRVSRPGRALYRGTTLRIDLGKS